MTESAGSPAALRAGNRARVIGVLREHGEMTRAAPARATGLSPATVSNIVRELRGAGTVDPLRGSAGRRGVQVLCSNRRHHGHRRRGARLAPSAPPAPPAPVLADSGAARC